MRLALASLRQGCPGLQAPGGNSVARLPKSGSCPAAGWGPALLAALLAAAPASAQPRAWSLTWTAPAGCPTETALRAQVESLVGAASPSAVPVRLAAAATPDGAGRWRAELVTDVRGARGTRSLEAATCRELADAVAVILAWMIDPAAAGAPPPPATGEVTAPAVGASGAASPATPSSTASPTVPSEPTPATSTTAPPPADTPAPPVVSTRPRPAVAAPARGSRWRFHAGVGARGDLGVMPSFAAGAELWMALGRGRWRVAVDASWRPAVERTLSSSSAGGRFELWTVGAQGCHRWPARPVAPAVCAGAEAGRFAAQGFGVSEPGSAVEPWVALRAGAAADVPLASWVAITARVDALVPVVRPNFVLERVGEVFQPSAVGLRAGIGVEAHF